MKIVLRLAGPLFIAVYCCWAFLVRTRDGIAPMAAAMVDYGAGVAALGIGLVWFGWQ